MNIQSAQKQEKPKVTNPDHPQEKLMIRDHRQRKSKGHLQPQQQWLQRQNQRKF